MNTEEKVEFLSRDTTFGILTRPALEIALTELSDCALLYVIDIKNLHQLNRRHGYRYVNGLVRNILLRIQNTFPHVVIGRVFSGDEIAFVDPTQSLEMGDVIPFFPEIGFNSVVGWVEDGKDISYYSELLDELTERFSNPLYTQII